MGRPSGLSDDAAAQLERLPGDAPVPYDAARLDGAKGLVDALLGTGSTGAPRGADGGAVEAINAAGGNVIAADVPSGVDASTGEVAGAAVRAAATATFHAAKPGLWIAPGKAHAGAVTSSTSASRPARPARPTSGSSARGCCATCRGAARRRPSSAPATWSSSAARAA